MDALLAQHRKQQRDLQSQITSRKKNATKKTRKQVNDDCVRLESDLKERQSAEIAAFDGSSGDAQPSSHDKNGSIDDDLLAAIVAESSLQDREENGSTLQNQPLEGTTELKKPNRQKARLARRAAEQESQIAAAAEEAKSLPDLRKEERTVLVAEFKAKNLVERPVAANGHCLYSSVADQLRRLGLDVVEPGKSSEEETELKNEDYKAVRAVAARFIMSNKDDFVPFLEEAAEEYVQKIEHTAEWGGQVELLALARAYGVTIHVVQAGRTEEIEPGDGKSKGDAWLAYYRHGFGLGEHYNSLRPAKEDTSAGVGARVAATEDADGE